MRQVNIHEAKTRLSELIAAVEAGEEVVIARAGKPVVRLVNEAVTPKVYRQGGGWAGKVAFDDAAWEAADRDMQAVFEESTNTSIEGYEPR
ncbi:MAG: type II toxin-antitoxin system Phd/YefM family antitoxin [Oxalobacteraceae bacterium]|nr:MAG: type II toxin-antitoxin system Phd/YefM family antitoxin [Oxalobacteraceae bacterium]